MSNYPSYHSDYNLNMIKKLKDKFKLHVGLSDHSEGDTVALAATALGAKVIEKHVKMKGDNTSHDSKFSMDTEKFKSFFKKINLAWETLGTDDFSKRKDIESKKYRRSIFVTKDIKKNQLITKSNIKKIRPSKGIHPKFYFQILGKKVKKNIYAGTPLKFNLIK